MESNSLPEFLLARIAEDADIQLTDPAGHCDMLDGAHYSPDRVLAECEAKRRIIGLHEMTDHDGCGECGPDTGLSPNAQLCPTLRLLALPYADHPEFREEWRPC